MKNIDEYRRYSFYGASRMSYIKCNECGKKIKNKLLMVLHDLFFHKSLVAITKTNLYLAWWNEYRHVTYPTFDIKQEKGKYIWEEITINWTQLLFFLSLKQYEKP